MSTVTIEEMDDRYVVMLNRPAQRNAINLAMINELHAACERVEGAPKPVLLTGCGEHFAGGADIGELSERGRADALAGINRTLFDRVAALPLPTVAAVSGFALGGGAELAYACDIRIVNPAAVFGNPEPGLGILAAAGATYRLPTLVGLSVAKQILLGGARLDADAALRVGLAIDVVDDPVGHAHDLINRVVQEAPLALQLTKKIIDSPDTAPWVNDIAQAVLFETEEKKQRMSRFLERKK